MIVSRLMNWSVVLTVFKAVVSLGAVMFFSFGSVMFTDPAEVWRQVIVLGDNAPSTLLAYTFGAVTAAVVIYAMIGLVIAFDNPDSGNLKGWWHRH